MSEAHEFFLPPLPESSMPGMCWSRTFGTPRYFVDGFPGAGPAEQWPFMGPRNYGKYASPKYGPPKSRNASPPWPNLRNASPPTSTRASRRRQSAPCTLVLFGVLDWLVEEMKGVRKYLFFFRFFNPKKTIRQMVFWSSKNGGEKRFLWVW